MNRITIPNAVAVCAAIFALGIGSAQAVTCSVPSIPYPTIQSAAIDASCDVINVAPGVYNENVTVNHSCALNGAKAGVPVAGRTSGGPGESTVRGASTVGASAAFAIIAPDVMIDGFSIMNNVNITGAAFGVSISGAGNGAGIVNNIFDMISTADVSGNGTAQAVYLTSTGPDDVNIENNEMKNVHSNRSAKGVLIGDNGGADPSQNVQVKGNSIHDITSDTRGAYGVSVANVTNVSGLKVVENKFSTLNGVGWVHVVGLEGDTPGAMILNNTISGLTSGGADIIGVWFESNPSFGSAQVHNNNFNLPASQFGIASAVAGGPVSGTCNWWNSPTGPTSASNPGGTGAQVGPYVTFNPWLIAPAPGGSCYGGNVPAEANQCKNGGWMTRTRADGSTFKNQGDCIQYVNTGR